MQTRRYPLAAILLLALLLSGCSRAPVSGQLVDFVSGEPIEGAHVTLAQRGWGVSGAQLVWDRSYAASARTQADGRFTLSLPAPLLAGRRARLEVAHNGYQRLTEVGAHAGAALRLQAMPVPPQSVPGGLATFGLLADGQPFGWSFVENRPTADPALADLFPEHVRRAPLGLALAAPGGGVQLLTQQAQGIATASYGHLLRYAARAPDSGYRRHVELDGNTTATLFVRTRSDRYAKLAFDPQRLSSIQGKVDGLDQPVAYAVQLPFAYNPWPGRDLPFDPVSAVRSVDPLLAAAAAELPVDGKPSAAARHIELRTVDERGNPVDRMSMLLEPDLPRAFECPDARFQYRDVVLGYGSDGLPRVRLSVHGAGFVHHHAPVLVSRRLPAMLRFEQYGSAPRPVSYVLQLREVDGPATGC